MDVSTCVAATLQIADIVKESSIVSFHAIFTVDITCDCGAFVMSPRMYERDNTHTTLRTRVCYHTAHTVLVTRASQFQSGCVVWSTPLPLLHKLPFFFTLHSHK